MIQEGKWLFKITEAADILGISKHFMRKIIKRGDIDVLRIGRAVRIRKKDLEKIYNNETVIK